MVGRNINIDLGGAPPPERGRPFYTPEQIAQRRVSDSGLFIMGAVQWMAYALAFAAFLGTVGFIIGLADSWRMMVILIIVTAVYIGAALALPWTARLNPQNADSIEILWLAMIMVVSAALAIAVLTSDPDSDLHVAGVDFSHKALLPYIDVPGKLSTATGLDTANLKRLLILALTIGATPLSGVLYCWGKVGEINCHRMADGSFMMSEAANRAPAGPTTDLAYNPTDGFQMWAPRLTERPNQGTRVMVEDAYNDYKQTQELNGMQAWTKAKFSRELSKLAQKTHGRVNQTVYQGHSAYDGWELPMQDMGTIRDAEFIPLLTKR